MTSDVLLLFLSIPPPRLPALQVPHQVAGGEEGVSAVQHAGLAAGPAGGQHGRQRAHAAAAARDRERGVADEDPRPATPGPAPPCSGSATPPLLM